MFMDFENARPLKIKKLCSAFENLFNPEFYFNGESHNFWECVCILGGVAGVTADDRIYTLNTGEMIFHKPMEFHKVWNEGTEPLHLFIVSFYTDSPLIWELTEKICTFKDANNIYFDNVLRTYRRFQKDNPAGYTPWVYDSIKMQIFCNSIEAFLLSVIKEHNFLSLPKHSEETKQFHLLVKTMRNKISGKLTIKELANTAHMSESTVKRLFKKYAGCSVHYYFLNMKLKEAILLLEKGEKVSAISDKLGFDNPNYFSIVFKRMTGHSPRDYKKLL